MKPLQFSLFALIVAFKLSSALAQTTSSTHYVVIGAFRILDNAVRYTAQANKNGFNAQYAINPAKQLYYVHLLNTDDRQKAFNLLIKIKVETIYKDSWVFSGKLGNEDPVKPTPVVEPKAESGEKPAVKLAPITEPKVERVEKPVVNTVPMTDTIKTFPSIVDSTLVRKPVDVKKPKGNPFYIRVVSKEDGKELFGALQLQEPDATRYEAIKSGEIVYLEAPSNKKGLYKVIAQVPGYKQSDLEFPYASTAAERGSQNETIVTLTVAKAKKGDYIDFNSVHFFKNTSVMQAESQNELNGLVSLMKENLKYKIKIHGHCNGTQNRESYTMGTSTKFFAMDPTSNKKQTISSKELSLARAETVKAYLVQQGIDASRIGTKGEGGKIPLYPEGGTLGQYNDRVEVEFVRN